MAKKKRPTQKPVTSKLLGLGGKLGSGVMMAGNVGFGIMGILQLLDMIRGASGPSQGEVAREAQDQTAEDFFNDPLVHQEMGQRMSGRALSNGVQVANQGFLGRDGSDDSFLSEMEMRHGQRLRDMAQRSTPTLAETAIRAGLM